MNIKVKEIKWKNAQYATYGYVGMISFFTIGYDGLRGKGYFLASPLLGVLKKHYSSTEVCKQKAKEVLKNWLSLVVGE